MKTGGFISRKVWLISLCTSAVVWLGSCSQQTGTDNLVNIPPVTLTCATVSNCTSNNSAHTAFVYITNSGCVNITYGQVASGTGQVTCSGGTCTATVTSWVNSSGNAVTQIGASTYDFCALLNLDNSYAGTITAAEATGADRGVTVSSSAAITITTWANGAFTN